SSQSPSPRREIVEAFVHKGWALLALDQNAGAYASFRAALQEDPKLRLSEDRFPHYVIQAFESMHRQSKKPSAWDPIKVGATAAAGAGAVAMGLNAERP